MLTDKIYYKIIYILDVSSLYTNIDIDEGLTIVQEENIPEQTKA